MRGAAYLLITLIALVTASAHAGDVSKTMAEADAYLDKGQYLEAIDAYQHIVERTDLSDELRAKALLRIGDIYSHFLNHYDKALEQYAIVKKRYAQSPYAANAYFNTGMILYEKNRYPEAREQFRAYIEKYPGGNRRDTAVFMMDASSKAPPAKEKQKPSPDIPAGKAIRVLIAESIPHVRIDSPFPLEIGEHSGNHTLSREVKSAAIDVRNGNITLNDNQVPESEVSIHPSPGKLLSVNGTPYRGHVRIRKGSRAGLEVLNILPLEAYLYGTVPKEMSPQWFPEALKAQAIAARTYALYQMSKNESRPFDVLATTASQVYGGVTAETERTNRAVDDTKGLIMLYKGQLVLAYFHANSGGMTEDAARVWSADIPYLKAVRDDYSLKAPGCNWKKTFGSHEIRAALNRNGIDVGPIEKITPELMSPTGRIMKIRIAHGDKDSVLSGNDFRLKIAPSLIKSTYMAVSQHNREISFDGKGYGHGVGMSQWGAYMMAKEGLSFQDILHHYYQGVEIGTL